MAILARAAVSPNACAASKLSVGVPLSVKLIEATLESLSSASMFADTFAALSDTSIATFGLLIFAKTAASLTSCAAETVSAGVPASISAIAPRKVSLASASR